MSWTKLFGAMLITVVFVVVWAVLFLNLIVVPVYGYEPIKVLRDGGFKAVVSYEVLFFALVVAIALIAGLYASTALIAIKFVICVVAEFLAVVFNAVLPLLVDVALAESAYYVLYEGELSSGPCSVMLKHGGDLYFFRSVADLCDLPNSFRGFGTGDRVVVYIVPSAHEMDLGIGPTANSAECLYAEGLILRGEWLREYILYGQSFERWWRSQLAMDSHKLNPYQLHLRLRHWRTLKAAGLVV